MTDLLVRAAQQAAGQARSTAADIELDLALDIDHLAIPDAGACRDPSWMSERVAAEVDDRRSVDLTDHVTAGVDQHGLAVDRFDHAFADPAGAVELGVERRLHVRGRRGRVAILFGRRAAERSSIIVPKLATVRRPGMKSWTLAIRARFLRPSDPARSTVGT